MAEAEQQLVVQLEARIRDFERNFQKASRVANDNWRGIENRGRTAARNLESTFLSTSNVANAALERMGAGIGSLKGQIGGLASALTGALSINQLRRYVDAWQELRNRIAAAGEAPERVGERASSITDIAIRSRSDVAATGDLYAGLTRSTKELGANQAQVLQATETISKAFTAGGQSAQTAAGAITQLNQAMSAGKLSGDELNSVLEGAPALARLIAAEFGVSVGQLKKLAEEGKLTSDKVFGAILKGAATIEAEFARTRSCGQTGFPNQLMSDSTLLFEEGSCASRLDERCGMGVLRAVPDREPDAGRATAAGSSAGVGRGSLRDAHGCAMA